MLDIVWHYFKREGTPRRRPGKWMDDMVSSSLRKGIRPASLFTSLHSACSAFRRRYKATLESRISCFPEASRYCFTGIITLMASLSTVKL